MIYNSKWWSYRIAKKVGSETYRVEFNQRWVRWLFSWSSFHRRFTSKQEAIDYIAGCVEEDHTPPDQYRPLE